jgi:hypothetical protein
MELSGNKKSADTQKKKYGDDFHARIGAKGGAAKVRKGMAVFLDSLTPEQKADFFRRRNEKRWGKNEK